MRSLLSLLMIVVLSGCSSRPQRARLREPVDAWPQPGAPQHDQTHGQTPNQAHARADSPPERQLLLPGVAPLVEAAIEAGRLPGAVVAVGDVRGVRYLRAFGQRVLQPAREAMSTDTIFDLASLTKPIATATAIGLLMDDGKLGLDDRVAKHLPGFARAGKGAVTVRQLLVHGGGLPPVTPRADFERPRAEALRKLQAVAPAHPPGTEFVYSDTGYLLLGAMVEAVAGQRLDSLLQRRVFGPLGTPSLHFGTDPALRERVAPTETRDDVPIRGEVHDPRAFRLGGVAGSAGLFATAEDLARFARMLLAGGSLDGTTFLSATTLAKLTDSHRIGDAVRTPGWDRDSRYSRLRGTLLSPSAYGHGGFTGTSLWVDPERGLFVVFLSNRVHPDGGGDVIRLVGEVTDAAVRDWMPRRAAGVCDIPRGTTKAGVDALIDGDFAALQGRRVGLVVNASSRTRDGVRTIDALNAAQGVELRALFTPEHGLAGTAEGTVADGRDRATGLPIHSLFGRTRTPTVAMLRGIDTLVFDLQDVGARFFTYMSTLLRLLEVAAERDLRVVVLDRPNPLGGTVVEGPLLDPGIETFVHYHRLPVRHGMTAGELAQLLNVERGLGAELQVVWMEGYRRDFLFADTGLPWRPPSPNLPTLLSVMAYPATALLESTNVSVGRGTDRPFEWFGAPWLRAEALVERLRAAELPGVEMRATGRTPRSAVHHGRPCEGVLLGIGDPDGFRAVRTGLSIAAALVAQHRDGWDRTDLPRMVGHRASTTALAAGAGWPQLRAGLRQDVAAFERVRAAALHYTMCDGGK